MWLDHCLAIHQLTGLSPLWGRHDHACTTSLCVDTFFHVLGVYLGVVLLWWRGEHSDPASRFPVFLLASLETCCGSCPLLRPRPLISPGVGRPDYKREQPCSPVPLPGHGSCSWLHHGQRARSTVPSAGPFLTPLPLSAPQSLSPSLQRACSADVLSGYYPQLAWSSPGGGPGRRSERVTFGQRPGTM